MVASKSMAMVAGGVNFCSIARDFGLLPFCRDFRNVWRDSCSDFFFFFFSFYEKRVGMEFSIFPNSVSDYEEICDAKLERGFVVIRIRIC